MNNWKLTKREREQDVFCFKAKILSYSLTSNLSQATKNQLSSGLELLDNIVHCLIVNGLLHVHFPLKAT